MIDQESPSVLENVSESFRATQFLERFESHQYKAKETLLCYEIWLYSGSKNCPNVLAMLTICLISLEINYVIFLKYSPEH